MIIWTAFLYKKKGSLDVQILFKNLSFKIIRLFYKKYNLSFGNTALKIEP